MFRKLVTLQQAKAIIHESCPLKPVRPEQLALLQAVGRVLAEDVTANLSIPPFSRSTVDGFAVKASDTFGAQENRPVRLRVSGTISIGEAARTVIHRGEAAETVTGAPLPKGADAVVMAEYTLKVDQRVDVSSPVTKNENVMSKGSDIMQGETVLVKGTVLGSKEIGILAALGFSRILVFGIPKVAVLSTGPELTELGRRLTAGRIYDINGYSLSTAVVESRGRPDFLGVFPDVFSELQKALKKGLALADLVVTSGGVSVGPKDVMPKAVNSLGKPGVIVSGVSVKPGKPVTVALVKDKLVFCLPGHPTSALLMFHLLVRPVVLALGGRQENTGLLVEATAGAKMFSAKGRRTFVMVNLKQGRNRVQVAEPVQSGLSGAISTLADADGFVEIPENVQFIEEGEKVVVNLFNRCS